MTLTRLAPLCLFAAALPLFDRPLGAQTYTAQRVQFSALGSFTQQQLEDAAGIRKGTTFTADDLGAAAQRLVDTGYFEDVGASLDGKVTGVTVKFDDKPIDKSHMLHVGFANFVWLSHDEIEAAIHAKLPLYIDYLPEGSPRRDDIKADLTAALAAKSIAASVAYEDFDPTLRHPQREIGFRIAKPSVRVANIRLAGVTADLAPLVQKSVNSTARTLYTEGPADQTTADRMLAPPRDAGYVQAALTEVALTPTLTPEGDASVVLSARLEVGDIYRVASLAFAGTPIVPAEDFNKSAKLHPGDLASRTALLETLTPVDAAYRRKGYMDVALHAVPTFDPAAHTVAYAIDVDPGEPYRVHELTANNLDPAARADLDKYFLMKAGDFYNPEYVAKFLTNNTALRSFLGYSAAFKAYADPGTHTVDVVIDFIRSGR